MRALLRRVCQRLRHLTLRGVLAAACVNPLPNRLDCPRALALTKFEMLGCPENATRFSLGLDLVEVGDHCQDLMVLVLLHAFRDRLEHLSSRVPPPTTALAFSILLAKAGIRAVAVDG